MSDTILTYRGADISLEDLIREHEKLEEAVKNHDPMITYRGASAHYTELHQEAVPVTPKNDPIIQYRGASCRRSELYK